MNGITRRRFGSSGLLAFRPSGKLRRAIRLAPSKPGHGPLRKRATASYANRVGS